VLYLPYNTGRIKRLFHFYSFLISFTWKEKIDILFTVQFKYCFIIGLLARARIKILDYRSGDLSSNVLRRKWNNISMRFDALFFSNISVISIGLRDILKLNKLKTLILPLGADIISGKQRSFERMDLLYVGTLSLRNIYQTIEGVELFLSKHPELLKLFSYTIIGFGSVEDEVNIKVLIKRLGLNDSVHFVGRKKYSDLRVYFDVCNIGITYVPITPYYE